MGARGGELRGPRHRLQAFRGGTREALGIAAAGMVANSLILLARVVVARNKKS